MQSDLRRWAMLTWMSWLIGCGGGPANGPVTGKVTLDGQPLENASVMFRPVAKAKSKGEAVPASYGRTDKQGTFHLSEPISGKAGALVGTHDVVIDVVDKADMDSDAAARQPRRRLPKKYNSETELKFEVKAAEANVANFDLKTK